MTNKNNVLQLVKREKPRECEDIRLRRVWHAINKIEDKNIKAVLRKSYIDALFFRHGEP